MLSLHQLRCFLATYEQGSLTGAADALGYAQPSVSEQVRQLEQTLGTELFRRRGRGVVPTEAADVLRPHAERTLAEAAMARQAVASVTALETGTIRFGIFGTARLYLGATLIADVLAKHPGVRVELIGQNSAAVGEDLRRGRLEAAMIALPVSMPGMTVRPVAREELVYISSDPERLASPVTMRQLAAASLVLSETTWRTEDSSRRMLTHAVQQTGETLETRIEVEDVETSVELVGMGLADSVVPRGVFNELAPRLAPAIGAVSLRPRMYDTLAVVHRSDAALSPAARLVIELATARIQQVAEPIRTSKATKNRHSTPANGLGHVFERE
jgi:DNA-binding transcriptional LysR family regulator